MPIRNSRKLSAVLCVAIATVLPASSANAKYPHDDMAQLSLYHGGDVTADQVRGDLYYCFELAAPALSQRSAIAGTNQYGLLGSMINSWLGDGPTRRRRNAIVDRCMLAHGYRVIRTDEAVWRKQLGISEDVKVRPAQLDAVVIDALAEFAASPLPEGMKIKS